MILLVDGYSAIFLFVESSLDGRFESSSNNNNNNDLIWHIHLHGSSSDLL